MPTDVGTSATPYRVKILERTTFPKIVVHPWLSAQLEFAPFEPILIIRVELEKSAGVDLQVGT
jgi:hypothetical protein